ncbi:MAG: hypothetical protein JNL98_03665 [Bryobacterales bacterium]|nr:hypothetical protein [Bryobacterales bacterium]
MKRLSTPIGFAGRFAGTSSETATIDIATTNCTFTAQVGGKPPVNVSPILVPLTGPDGQVIDVTIMASGPAGGSAVVTITPVDDFPEVDLMLIDNLVPFPINRYRFHTTSAVLRMAAPAVTAKAVKKARKAKARKARG